MKAEIKSVKTYQVTCPECGHVHNLSHDEWTAIVCQGCRIELHKNNDSEKSELQKRVEATGRVYLPWADTLYADEFRVGTSKYRGVAYFWAFEYRHHGLRGFIDINLHHSSLHKFRRDVHNEFLKNNLELAGVSELHEAIIDKHATIAYAKAS